MNISQLIALLNSIDVGEIDTIRAKLGGAVEELGGDSTAKDQALQQNRLALLQSIAALFDGRMPGQRRVCNL